jgi:hypothetical protein
MSMGRKNQDWMMKIYQGLGLSLTLLLLAPAVQAAVINAASCSLSAVQTAVNSAQAGDTVQIPACPSGVGWSGKLSWTAPANVTLKGAGTSVTGGGDQTVIIDNYGSNDNLVSIGVSSTGVFRLSGITFQSGSGGIKDGGAISIYGPGKVRLDHLTLNATNSATRQVLSLRNGLFGVLDRSVLNFTDTNSIYLYNGRRGSNDWMANYEWAQPTKFGSDEYFFIEDNIINGSATWDTYAIRVFDGFTGAKVVVRFNTVVAAVLGETHATGHAPDDRGLRSQEIYLNSVTSPLARYPNYAMLDMGSGTTLVWGNSANNVYKNMFLFKTTRINNSTYNQTATPNGWGYCGTQFNGVGSNWDGGTALGTNTTTGYPCLDQPGRGQGDLITGGFPNKLNSTTGTLRWPNQALEPIYIWANTGNIVSGWGGSYYSNNSGGRVAANRDYYPQASGIQTSQTSPFDGTSGTGWGTIARRPSTCTPGVGYWATDEGSWNTSTSNLYGVQVSGADGRLYKCTVTNTWTLYYEPYTYPHPLRAEVQDTTPPSTPTNLSATTQSSSQINLSWTASTDNVGIAGYDIRRCSGSGCTPSSIVHSTTGTGTTWNNTGLSASTIYRYDVRARDAVPNYSSYSTIAQATTQTPADTTPPIVIIATADPTKIHISSLTVTGISSDAVGVSGCKWRRTLAPNASNGTLCTGTTSFSCATSGYSQGANTLYVGCFDAAGNYGSDSMVVNYYPPLSAPTNLQIY